MKRLRFASLDRSARRCGHSGTSYITSLPAASALPAHLVTPVTPFIIFLLIIFLYYLSFSRTHSLLPSSSSSSLFYFLHPSYSPSLSLHTASPFSLSTPFSLPSAPPPLLTIKTHASAPITHPPNLITVCIIILPPFIAPAPSPPPHKSTPAWQPAWR